MISGLEEFVSALELECPTFKNKITYRLWKKGAVPPLPYIVYYSRRSDNFAADNKVYSKHEKVVVELYSHKKDLAKEATIETFFENNNIVWEKTSEEYWEEESLYEIVYEIEI